MTTTRNGFETMDLQASMTAVPQRSLLFALDPIDDGTCNQESLLSLLIRTAHAHSVSPRLLIRDVLSSTNASIKTSATAAFHQRLAGTMNGLGQYAERFSSAMAHATGKADLRHLTLLRWKELFPHNGQGLLARFPRWCPVCVDRQRNRGEVPAFRLSWSLEACKICQDDNVPLIENCPACDRKQPFVPRSPNLAVCNYCGGALTKLRSAAMPTLAQHWLANATGKMIAESSGGITPTVDRFRTFVQQQVDLHTTGNRAAFCRSIGFNEFAISGWLNKGKRPSPSMFLQFCYCTQTDPARLFSEELRPAPLPCLRTIPKQSKSRAERPGLSVNQRAKVRTRLQEHFRRTDSFSATEIARQIGLTRSCLRYWFPDLFAALVERHKKHREELTKALGIRRKQQVMNAIARIRETGEYPSKRKVVRLLRSGMMVQQKRSR